MKGYAQKAFPMGSSLSDLTAANTGICCLLTRHEYCIIQPMRALRSCLVCLVALMLNHCGGKAVVDRQQQEVCSLPSAVGRAPGQESTTTDQCELYAQDEEGNEFEMLCTLKDCDCSYNGAYVCSCRPDPHNTCSNGVGTCCANFPWRDL